MFKIIFKAIVVVFFIMFLAVSLALWKGGEPFRWVGDGLVVIGNEITDFGNVVDDFIKGSKEFRDNVERVKDAISSDEGGKK